MKSKLLMILGSVVFLVNFSVSATECSAKVTGLAVTHLGYEVELSHAKFEYYYLDRSRNDFLMALDAYENAKTLKLTFSGNQSCSALRGDNSSATPYKVELVTTTGGGDSGCMMPGFNDKTLVGDKSDEESIIMLPDC